MNILASPLPATVEVGGASVPVRTGYRTGIAVARLVDSTLPTEVIVTAVLGTLFPDPPPPDATGALDAALEFHRCGKPAPKKASRKRLLDWDHDAGTVLADFRREYAIDLSDPATRMHWWVFMALFEGLTPESGIKTAMHWRGASRPKGATGDEARRWSEVKRAYALPPKTSAEAIAREAAMWGDD